MRTVSCLWRELPVGRRIVLVAAIAIASSCPSPAHAVTIDNDIPTAVLGSWSVSIDSGGNTSFASLTAKQLVSGNIITEDVLYDYDTYVDVGALGGGFPLFGSTPTISAEDPDQASSSGTFLGEFGNTIAWTATSYIPDGELTMTTVFTFVSQNGQPMGRVRLYQYLDEDIEDFTDDVFFTRGTTVNDTFELFTSDGPQAYGVSQSGAFRFGLGLVNSHFAGWAANEWDAMRPRITGAGQPVSLTGLIEGLGSTTHPSFGAVRGPADVVSVMAWDVNEGVVSATILTSLGGTPDDRSPVEPPEIEKPKDGEAKPIGGGIDRSRPTIVLTHGLEDEAQPLESLWTGIGSRQAASLIDARLGDPVNIIQYVWGDGFQPFASGVPTASSYTAARGSVTTAGTQLAEQLVELLGDDYSKSIHFIGHSLGSIVNAYAARQFLDAVPSVTEAQFTALDRPHHVSDFDGIALEEEDALGFDEDFFTGVLPICRQGLSLKVDNYFSHDGRTGRGLGDRANGPIYNHTDLVNPKKIDDLVFLNEVFDNNSDGVQQWYRWTMSPRSPVPSGTSVCSGSTFISPSSGFDASLNPCQRGFAWSLNSNVTFPPRPACEGGEPERDDLEVPSLRDFGCVIEGTGAAVRIVCDREPSDTSAPARAVDDQEVVLFGTGPVTIPDGTQYLEFEYEFNGAVGSYATVLIDNFIVWKGIGPAPDGTRRSSPIPIDGFPGNHIITIAMYGQKGTRAKFSVFNLRTFSTPVCGDAKLNTGERCDAGPFRRGFRCGQACEFVECGDVDDSGSLTVSDAQFVLQAAVGAKSCELVVCDVDNSGAVNTVDALKVLLGAVGLTTTRACPAP